MTRRSNIFNTRVAQTFKKDNTTKRSWSVFYNETRWRDLSKSFLSKNPLCVQCLKSDRITSSAVVDHIKPHRGDKTAFYNISNLQALCKRCHDMKTHSETHSTVQRNPRIDYTNTAGSDFIVIVGCSGSGRHAHARKQYPEHTIISSNLCLQELSGSMYDATEGWEVIAAYRERNELIRKAATQEKGKYAVIISNPGHTQRRQYKDKLGARVEVVLCSNVDVRFKEEDKTFKDKLTLDNDDRLINTRHHTP